MEHIKKNFGFGCMRLPMKDGEVDIEQTCRMVDAFLENGFNVGIFCTCPRAEGGDLRLHLQDQPLQFFLALLTGFGVDVPGVLLAVRPYWRVTAFPEVLPKLADAPSSWSTPGRFNRHKVLLWGFVCLFRYGLHFRLGDPLVDVQRRFSPHLVGDVGIGVQRGRRGDMADNS